MDLVSNPLLFSSLLVHVPAFFAPVFCMDLGHTNFFDFSIFPGKMTVHATKGAVECFRERLSGGREVISLEADKAGTGYCAKEIQ